MSIIFQLFCADDLQRLTEQQIVELKDIVREQMKDVPDTSLGSFIAVSKHIKNAHMQRLLPNNEVVKKEHALRNLAPRQLQALIERGDRPPSVEVVGEKGPEYPPEVINWLKRRAREVFDQLMSGASRVQAGTNYQAEGAPRDLLAQLFSQRELDALKDKLGTKGHIILAWALTCELTNLKTYTALRNIRELTHAKFTEFTHQLPKGPDSPYSPFYPLHPLSTPRYPGQP